MTSLIIKLDKAYENLDYQKISELITDYIKSRHFFQPGFSNFEEIVTEYLCGQWIMDPVIYLKERYKISKRESNMLVKTLRLFSKYVD